MTRRISRRSLAQLAMGALLGIALAGGGDAAQAQAPAVSAVPGQPALLLGHYDLGALGYTTEEFFISGEASAYKPTGRTGQDGRWSVAPAERAPYTTRVVVVRPSDPARFNGTAVVEWLNVTAGVDASPDWNATHRELIRSGYAYVGVSAQRVGVEGGPRLGQADMSLKKLNPARYGPLAHPGDAYSFDIFSQAGRLARSPDLGGLLGPLTAKRVIGVGESQSATFLATYVNAVDPLAKAYDGFLIHSRFGVVASLDGASMIEPPPGGLPLGVRLRGDVRVPTLTVITESDLLGGNVPGYHLARQPDAERLRIWEVPGTAHADTYTVQAGHIDDGSTSIAKLAAAYAPPSNFLGSGLAKPMNFAPQHHYVVEAALSSLDRWIRTGQAAPKAERMQLTVAASPALVLDANGLAQGGVRTPWVDVPTARLSGGGNSGSAMAWLFGVGEVFDPAKLQQLYPGGKAEYLRKFEASLDSAIKAGFLLPADRQEMLELAAAMYPGS